MEANGESKPSTEIEEMWIYHDRMDRGKWLLFYDKDKLDEAWQKAKDLFDHDELVGNSSMKVSTMKKNPRAFSATEGVIVFYCGPWNDTENMLTFGKNILDKMDYNFLSQDHHPFTLPFFTFKTEVQSATGTRSLGQLKNHSLRLPFPVPDGTSLDILDPMDVDTSQWIYHWRPEQISRWGASFTPDDHGGVWSLFYEKDRLSEDWTKAARLYDDDQLQGIIYMKCSTAFEKDGGQKYPCGVILFSCGPSFNEELILSYGRNILRMMGYRRGVDTNYNKIKFSASLHGTETSTLKYSLPI